MSNNVLGNVFGNIRSNLTTLEQVLTGVLDAQAVIVQFAAPNAGTARIVSIGFAVVASVALVVKNVLANTTPAPVPPATPFKRG